MYQSTKTFGANLGLSCAFRQWRATHSHCSKLHGYALEVKFTFSAETLDDKNWVVDFGATKDLKAFLETCFDHVTVIAEDDPEIEYFQQGAELGVLNLFVMKDVGCEKFAEFVYGYTKEWLVQRGLSPRCSLVSVEIREHGANSAIYSEE